MDPRLSEELLAYGCRNPPSPSEDNTQGSTVPMTEKVASQYISTTQASPIMFTSPTSRRDSLKRKVPHDGFDEPTPVGSNAAYQLLQTHLVYSRILGIPL